MTRDTDPFPDKDILVMMGVCLFCIQRTERVLSTSIEHILGQQAGAFAKQSYPEQKQTLGELVNRLKRQVKLEPKVKERLYEFLKMRNMLVHNVSEVPGWNLSTNEGQQAAMDFLAELAFSALAIMTLFITVSNAWLREQTGEDIFKKEQHRKVGAILEKTFGLRAQKFLEGIRK
jgi:hypothetical protein